MSGEKIGPAWQAGWDHIQMAPGRVDKRHVVAVMVAAGSISPVTAGNLLRAAARAGKITVNYVKDGYVMRAHYGKTED